MFNKYKSVSSQFNKHSRQYRHYIVDATTNQIQDLMCQKKYNLVSTEPIAHSQQYRYCIWPELEHKSFDRLALQHGSTRNCFSNRYFYYGIMEGEISTPLELFWPIHFTRISIPQAQVWSAVWPQVKIVLVNQESRLGLPSTWFRIWWTFFGI